MGVPNFYTWLVKRYPCCLYSLPQGHEIDFLYMDLNQVIYKSATDPTVLFKDQLKERNFDEVWVSIFNYIDQVITLAKPRKCLFLALDGVAPRAKMNQQRQRRFQSAKRYANLNKQLQNIGFIHKNETFKNNQISPGTSFMHELNRQIRFFIERKYVEDPKYAKLKVIFSGSDVPGEGEHKLLSFIRNLKLSPDFDPEWTHMIYGADADLIMLGLLTRLTNICILRENLKFKQVPIILYLKEVSAAASRVVKNIEFQIINLRMVADYMGYEYSPLASQMKIPYDIRRIIDDFILLCFFVGNDFLPRIFCFDIREGSIESLIELFKKHLLKADSYMVDAGELNIQEFAKLLELLTGFEKLCLDDRQREMEKYVSLNSDIKHQELNLVINKEIKLIQLMTEYYGQDYPEGRIQYYQSKCGIQPSSPQGMEELSEMTCNYTEGIQFVLYYYFQGVPSWEWHYKYYYAPLCSDIYLNVKHIMGSVSPNEKIFDFETIRAAPYPPFKQLLCILSPENASLLPKQYQHLLLSPDSPLRSPVDYYPSEFETDAYGTIYEHQHITKIPFLNKQLIDKVYDSVVQSEFPERNQMGQSTLYWYSDAANDTFISTLPNIYSNFTSKCKKSEIDLEGNVTQGLFVKKQKGKRKPPQLPNFGEQNVKETFMAINQEETRITKVLHIKIESAAIDHIQLLSDCLQNQFTIFAGFPVQEQYQAFGVLKPDMLYLFPDQDLLESDLVKSYQKKNHQQFYRDRTSEFISQLAKIGITLKCQDFLMLRKYKIRIRDNHGNPTFNQEKFKDAVIPAEFCSFVSNVNVQFFKFKPLAKGQQCVLFHSAEELNGALGTIQELAPPRIKVSLTQTPSKIQFQYTQDKDFFLVSYVAAKLDCNLECLLFLLGSVTVYLDFDKRDSMIAEALDVGFNLINRQQNLIVPELVRLRSADQYAIAREKYEQYYQLELSRETVESLCQYRNMMPNLILYLQNKTSKFFQNMPKLQAKDIFPNSPDPNIELIKVYVWILQLPTSHYQLLGCSSKVAKIEIIQHQQMKSTHKQLTVDEGYLINYQKHFLPPFYRQHPPIFKIGERVINLKYPFGLQGTIVGVSDMGGIIVQVLWDEPYIGFRNLGGRYPLLRCSVCNFIELYNISADWYSYLAARDQAKEQWDCYTKIYKPEYKHSAIEQDQQIQNNPFMALQKFPTQKMPKLLQKKPQEQDQEVGQNDVLKSILERVPDQVSHEPIKGAIYVEKIETELQQKPDKKVLIKPKQQQDSKPQQQGQALGEQMQKLEKAKQSEIIEKFEPKDKQEPQEKTKLSVLQKSKQ